MINLTGSELIDLKTEMDISEVWNDVRVMLPSYSTTLELKDDGWHRYPVDLVTRATDGPSINKYGRRTKTQSKHVIEQYFAESYCEGQVAKYKEPIPRADMSLIGRDATDIITALTINVADRITYEYAAAYINAVAIVDNLVLDVDLDGIPRLALNLTDASPLELADFFNVDIDTVGNATDLIG